MTTFATDIDAIVSSFIGIGCNIIILFEIGRMTCSTHRVPVLGISSPVQPVVGRYFLTCILVEPFLLVHVPTQSWNLHSPSRKCNQVLLQGSKSKNVFNFKIVIFPIVTFSIDEEFSAFFIKTTRYSISREGDIVEITHNCRIVWWQHCHIMMRLLPFLKFGRMTFLAGLISYIRYRIW